MSVYIKGMEMPGSCFYCPFRRKVDPDNIMCIVTRECFEETYAGTIETRNRGNCPLVPVPDHGDLIDRDETLKKLSPEQIKNVKPDMTWEEIYELNVLDIVTMPAIIPAEEGEG